MNSKVWQEVEDRSEGLCEFPIDGQPCNCNYMVQKHHIFGKYNRARLEKSGTVFDLCYNHHHDSHTGVHHNKDNRKILEDIAKDYLRSIGWSETKIIREISLASKGVGLWE